MGTPLPGAEARIANPALEPLHFLLGSWRTSGTHPLLPGEVLMGRTSFSRHEGGAFLIVRSRIDHPPIPDGLAIVGCDGGAGRFAMLYFDEREVSRLFDLTAGDRTVTWRRDDPELAQSTTIAADGPDRLVGRGRMSEKGGAWAGDLSLVDERE